MINQTDVEESLKIIKQINKTLIFFNCRKTQLVINHLFLIGDWQNVTQIMIATRSNCNGNVSLRLIKLMELGFIERKRECQFTYYRILNKNFCKFVSKIDSLKVLDNHFVNRFKK